MTAISAADIVFHLAQHLKDSGICPASLSKATDVPKERLTMIQTGEWEKLTIREIAAISQALDIDLLELITDRSADV